MFRLIGAGFVLLTLALFTGFVFVTNLFTQNLVQKTVLSLIAWLLFGVLLIGRVRFGWRGRSAVRWTLSGFGVLAVAYFGVEIRARVRARAALGLGLDACSHLPLGLLFAALAGLLLLAAFFAGSETALMSLNRYRLRHRANEGHRGARLAEALLAHPDRLDRPDPAAEHHRQCGDADAGGLHRLAPGRRVLVAFGAATLTFVLLIFCEVAPKTFGALHPERLALPAAYVYTPLLLVLYPVRLGHESAGQRRAAPVRRLAAAGLEFLEQRGAAHRGRRGRRHDSASPPADAGQHPGSGKRHRRGHHGAAQRDRRHRRRR